jgi:hypothetical protein
MEVKEREIGINHFFGSTNLNKENRKKKVASRKPNDSNNVTKMIRRSRMKIGVKKVEILLMIVPFSLIVLLVSDALDPGDTNKTNPKILKRAPDNKGINPAPGLRSSPILRFKDPRHNPNPKKNQIKPITRSAFFIETLYALKFSLNNFGKKFKNQSEASFFNKAKVFQNSPHLMKL